MSLTFLHKRWDLVSGQSEVLWLVVILACAAVPSGDVGIGPIEYAAMVGVGLGAFMIARKAQGPKQIRGMRVLVLCILSTLIGAAQEDVMGYLRSIMPLLVFAAAVFVGASLKDREVSYRVITAYLFLSVVRDILADLYWPHISVTGALAAAGGLHSRGASCSTSVFVLWLPAVALYSKRRTMWEAAFALGSVLLGVYAGLIIGVSRIAVLSLTATAVIYSFLHVRGLRSRLVVCLLVVVAMGIPYGVMNAISTRGYDLGAVSHLWQRLTEREVRPEAEEYIRLNQIRQALSLMAASHLGGWLGGVPDEIAVNARGSRFHNAFIDLLARFGVLTCTSYIVFTCYSLLILWLLWSQPAMPCWTMGCCLIIVLFTVRMQFFGFVRWRETVIPGIAYGMIVTAYAEYSKGILHTAELRWRRRRNVCHGGSLSLLNGVRVPSNITDTGGCGK